MQWTCVLKLIKETLKMSTSSEIEQRPTSYCRIMKKVALIMFKKRTLIFFLLFMLDLHLQWAYFVLFFIFLAVEDYQEAREFDQDSQEIRDGLERAQKLLKVSRKRDYYKILGVSRYANYSTQ